SFSEDVAVLDVDHFLEYISYSWHLLFPFRRSSIVRTRRFTTTPRLSHEATLRTFPRLCLPKMLKLFSRLSRPARPRPRCPPPLLRRPLVPRTTRMTNSTKLPGSIMRPCLPTSRLSILTPYRPPRPLSLLRRRTVCSKNSLSFAQEKSARNSLPLPNGLVSDKRSPTSALHPSSQGSQLMMIQPQRPPPRPRLSSNSKTLRSPPPLTSGSDLSQPGLLKRSSRPILIFSVPSIAAQTTPLDTRGRTA
ncbi:hypothetical protein BDZ88DRAFT_484187, partial [Geranomyces variabilis]